MNFSMRKQLTLIDSLQFLYQSLNNLAENIKDGQFMLIKNFLVKKYQNGSSKREYVLNNIRIILKNSIKINYQGKQLL